MTRAAVTLAAILAATTSAASDLELGKWGLEGPDVYQERQATAQQDSSHWPEAEEGEPRFRYFGVDEPDYSEKALPALNALEAFLQPYLDGGGEPEAVAFAGHVRQNKPFLAAELRDLAPVLFFDFYGAADKEYILQSVVIEVIDFSEYRGGGFADKEAAYDILLIPEAGFYEYVFDKALRFQGSGRAELRFFSANFYAAAGLSPMGSYRLDIAFQFRVDGTEDVTISTGPFKIDV